MPERRQLLLTGNCSHTILRSPDCMGLPAGKKSSRSGFGDQCAREYSMNRKYILSSLVLLLCCGCSHLSHTDNGVLAGTGVGAGTGAVIGSQVGNPVAGAVIGGGIGAVTGGLAGSALDHAERRAEDRAFRRIKSEQAIQAAQRPPLTMQDIIAMTHRHISDDIIIRQIETTGSVFQLTSRDIIYLQEQGVSQRVIGEMQVRQRPLVQQPQPVIVRPQREVTVIHEHCPPPPPRVSIGFGFSHHHRHRRGCWH